MNQENCAKVQTPRAQRMRVLNSHSQANALSHKATLSTTDISAFSYATIFTTGTFLDQLAIASLLNDEHPFFGVEGLKRCFCIYSFNTSNALNPLCQIISSSARLMYKKMASVWYLDDFDLHVYLNLNCNKQACLSLWLTKFHSSLILGMLNIQRFTHPLI